MTSTPTALESLQTTLAAEHAAIYVYGVLGGRVMAVDSPGNSLGLTRLLSSVYEVHRARRGQLETAIDELGETPVAAEVAYDLATPAMTIAQLREEARGIEQRCSTIYAAGVAGTTDRERSLMVDALIDSAVRGLSFGAEATAFPGN